MTVTFKMIDLGCAHCAAKMEKKILKLEGVISCQIHFFAQKMKLEVEDGSFTDLDALREKIAAIVRKIEPDCEVTL